MQQWARFAILGAMFVTAYLLILAWQKDYGHKADSSEPPVVVAQTGDNSTDLPTQQSAATEATDVPQANITATTPTTSVTAS
ncbi:hypothetical protein GWI33_010066, partial [Rhynchophorus ferrugineus]